VRICVLNYCKEEPLKGGEIVRFWKLYDTHLVRVRGECVCVCVCGFVRVCLFQCVVSIPVYSCAHLMVWIHPFNSFSQIMFSSYYFSNRRQKFWGEDEGKIKCETSQEALVYDLLATHGRHQSPNLFPWGSGCQREHSRSDHPEEAP
jgi:hypothetical protein